MIDESKPLGVTDRNASVLVERVFLVGLMENPHRMGDALLWGASGMWFSDALCSRVWSAMEALHSRNIPCDLALVTATVENFRDASDEAKAFAQVVKLGTFGVNECYLRHYAATLRRFAAERAAGDIARSLVEEQGSPVGVEDYAATVTHRAGELLSVADGVLREDGLDPRTAIAGASEEALGAATAKPGVLTGLSNLDRVIRGMRSGEMIVVGARPGVGKSSFAVTVCLNLLHRDPDAAIFFASVEMPAREIIKRFISGASGVSVEALEDGRVSPDERAAWSEAVGDIERAAPLIENRGMSNPAQVFATAQAFKIRRQRLDLVVVDHLHRMHGPGKSRTEQLTFISGSVARMAADLGCPVLALAQLNRGIETREDKRPTLADLRDSGSIEQDADMVIFLHRPNTNDASDDSKSRAVAYVAKNRRGVTGDVALRFKADITRFFSEEPADRAEQWNP